MSNHVSMCFFYKEFYIVPLIGHPKAWKRTSNVEQQLTKYKYFYIWAYLYSLSYIQPLLKYK